MSWFLRGVQSAVFHYASCAPCAGYSDGRKRRKAARAATKIKDKLHLEHPDAYHHPPPTGTNPYWDEEIRMGPGPPPRRARRTNTGSTRRITTAGTQSSALSKDGSSLDSSAADDVRLSDDTAADETWNHKRYQREDEDLWGLHEPPIPIHHLPSGSSVGVSGFNLRRPGTGKSASYCSVRAPPVNDLHPPVVSMPSPDPADNRWMLQPPPSAGVMAGRERATNRSRSGSGASSRVELSLQRQLSTKQVMQRLDRGETPDMPSISRNSSYSNLVSAQRHDMSRTAQARPPSAGSSRRQKRRDPTVSRSNTVSTQHSSGDSSDTILKSTSAPNARSNTDIKVIRVRQSRPALSTVVSSGSGANDLSPSTLHTRGSSDENAPPHHRRDITYTSTTSTDSTPYLMKHRAPLSSSDVSSLNCLQDLVSPPDLLKSRFVSAPLVEAKIRLPPSDTDEARTLTQKQSWAGSGFGISRSWGQEQSDGPVRVPFDSRGVPDRDPRLRWSVDF
ncbi:hypothetical protein CC86DRAFT_368268 [Ophiobolus disseminans]|uniref:Signal peptide-containing protein n=1 Tax=Ophiobolus disseminans TaxID=1469910 RepID=A0A6A7A9C6_9PLEO|nr:hypothetical protein CC86DRAFT_368268 [Ophiobolus disseminans]